MKPLLLVKHSLPEIQADRPAREWHLSEAGKVRAGQFANLLESHWPEVVISSVEAKAIQTAEIIAGQFDLSVQVMDGLHEHDRSRSPYYSRLEFQQLVHDFFSQPAALIFGGEPAEQALDRFRSAMDRVLITSQGQSVVVVSHGTVIALFAAWLAGCDGYDLWETLDLPSGVLLDMQNRQLLEVIHLD